MHLVGLETVTRWRRENEDVCERVWIYMDLVMKILTIGQVYCNLNTDFLIQRDNM